MKKIYFDNASTSYPKAPGLGKAIGEHIENRGVNISRGGYESAYNLEEEIIETREMLCRLLGFDNSKGVVFTPGATAGLNMIIKGLLRSGDHVITTAMEHNAVVRPLTQMKEIGVIWDEARCSQKGELDIEDIKSLIRPETRMILMLHGSNVCGSILPIEKIGKLCREKDIFFVVDASQTAGSVEINMKKACIDGLIFPGHKGLLGPQGVGGMVIADGLADVTVPLISGGTGSASDSEQMPSFMPDKFQPGTLNLPGIIGLKHAIGFIETEGRSAINDKKAFLTKRFIEGIMNIRGLQLIGPSIESERAGVVSLDFEDIDNAELSYILESRFGIMTRCGLHCAPHAHKTLGTFPHGTVRFSFGYFNTNTEIDLAVEAIDKIMKEDESRK